MSIYAGKAVGKGQEVSFVGDSGDERPSQRVSGSLLRPLEGAALEACGLGWLTLSGDAVCAGWKVLLEISVQHRDEVRTALVMVGSELVCSQWEAPGGSEVERV